MARHLVNLLLSLILLTSKLASGQNYTDRLCGDTLETLWLDVVVVIENTFGMTQEGLSTALGNAQTVFAQSTIGTNYTDPRNTRVAIITYDKVAKIIADLDTFQDVNELFNITLTVSSETESFIASGLRLADTVLSDGRKNGRRSNYRQLVILYASSYNGKGQNDPVPAADRLIDDGVTIATVAFSQQGVDDSLQKIGALATPPYNFTNTDINLSGELQGAAIQVNCFCPDLWTQYRDEVKDIHSQKYGTCLRPAEIQAAGTPARFACQNAFPQAHLFTEFTEKIHNYTRDLVESTATIPSPYVYFNGLIYVNGGWNWVQAVGEPLIPLNPNQTMWNPGFPIQPYSTYSAVVNQEYAPGQFGWVNVSPFKTSKNYVCQVNSCDTDHYCDS